MGNAPILPAFASCWISPLRWRVLARMPPRVLYISRRVLLLRAISLLLVGQVVLVAWLLSLAPRSEWTNALGDRFWWIAPGSLLALSMIVPAAMAWLNNRYVLRFDKAPDAVTVTTFTLWGRRSRTLSRSDLRNAQTSDAPADTWREALEVTASALRVRVPQLKLDLLFDRGGEFPDGEEAIREIFDAGVESSRGPHRKPSRAPSR